MNNLFAQRSALLIADDFAIEGLIMPRESLVLAGSMVELIGPQDLVVRTPNARIATSHTFFCDQLLSEADPAWYQNLVLIPGANSNRTLRQDPWAAAFIRHFLNGNGNVAILDDGFLALPDLRLLAGRTVAAPSSLRHDLIHAGAHWSEEPVLRDRGLVTCASLTHLHLFIRTMIETFAAPTNSALATMR